MATEREVIREFLVALGFNVDPVGIRKFTAALSNTSKLAGQTATVIASVTVAAELMVQKFARGMEKLYYASERTGAAVKNIQALEYGAEQIGLKGEDARAALEGLARSLRLNPGLIALLNSLGVPSEGRDKADIMRDLVTQLSKMPHFVGAQFAQMFGMDEQTFFHMKRWSTDLAAAERERLALQEKSGINAQEAAEASREYMNALRGVWERIEVLAQSLAVRLLPYFKEFIGLVRGILDELLEWRNFKLDLGEWEDQIMDIVNSLRQFKDLISWLIDSDPAKAIFWAIKNEAKGLAHALLDIVGALAALVSGDWRKAGQKALSAAKVILFGVEPEKSDAEKEVSKMLGRDTTGTSMGGAVVGRIGGGPAAEKTAAAPAGAQTPLGLRQNNPGNLRSWGQNTVRNGFAAFGSPAEGLSAMAGQLTRYARRGLTSVRDIITKYAPPSENNTAAYIAEVAKRMGVDASAALDLNNAGTLAKLMDAMIRHEQGYNPFGATDLAAAAQGRVGGGAPVMHQQNQINVHGAANANDVANRIGRELDRVNGDLVRNMAGAVQ